MTYPELVEFCGSERQAAYLAERIPYRDLTEAACVEYVTRLMVTAKEFASGPVELEYIGGQRRDTLRLNR